jgi:hypothetical protein
VVCVKSFFEECKEFAIVLERLCALAKEAVRSNKPPSAASQQPAGLAEVMIATCIQGQLDNVDRWTTADCFAKLTQIVISQINVDI